MPGIMPYRDAHKKDERTCGHFGSAEYRQGRNGVPQAQQVVPQKMPAVCIRYNMSVHGRQSDEGSQQRAALHAPKDYLVKWSNIGARVEIGRGTREKHTELTY
jgi:hypothetical protein